MQQQQWSSSGSLTRKLKGDWWKAKLCTACVSPLGRILSRGGHCPQCGLRVCKNCRNYDVPLSTNRGQSQKHLWICVLCSGSTPNFSGTLPKSSTLGKSMAKSIRRSWTISNPQRSGHQTDSPVLKSYVIYNDDNIITSSNMNNTRQFNSLPRLSYGISYQDENQPIDASERRFSYSTLYTFKNNKANSNTSVNFIEDPFWDYYDYNIMNSNRSSCERSLGEIEYCSYIIDPNEDSNSNKKPPTKPERSNKRSNSLNSYDGKKLSFSPLRTYVVLRNQQQQQQAQPTKKRSSSFNLDYLNGKRNRAELLSEPEIIKSDLIRPFSEHHLNCNINRSEMYSSLPKTQMRRNSAENDNYSNSVVRGVKFDESLRRDQLFSSQSLPKRKSKKDSYPELIRDGEVNNKAENKNNEKSSAKQPKLSFEERYREAPRIQKPPRKFVPGATSPTETSDYMRRFPEDPDQFPPNFLDPNSIFHENAKNFCASTKKFHENAKNFPFLHDKRTHSDNAAESSNFAARNPILAGNSNNFPAKISKYEQQHFPTRNLHSNNTEGFPPRNPNFSNNESSNDNFPTRRNSNENPHFSSPAARNYENYENYENMPNSHENYPTRSSAFAEVTTNSFQGKISVIADSKFPPSNSNVPSRSNSFAKGDAHEKDAKLEDLIRKSEKILNPPSLQGSPPLNINVVQINSEVSTFPRRKHLTTVPVQNSYTHSLDRNRRYPKNIVKISATTPSSSNEDLSPTDIGAVASGSSSSRKNNNNNNDCEKEKVEKEVSTTLAAHEDDSDEEKETIIRSEGLGGRRRLGGQVVTVGGGWVYTSSMPLAEECRRNHSQQQQQSHSSSLGSIGREGEKITQPLPSQRDEQVCNATAPTAPATTTTTTASTLKSNLSSSVNSGVSRNLAKSGGGGSSSSTNRLSDLAHQYARNPRDWRAGNVSKDYPGSPRPAASGNYLRITKGRSSNEFVTTVHINNDMCHEPLVVNPILRIYHPQTISSQTKTDLSPKVHNSSPPQHNITSEQSSSSVPGDSAQIKKQQFVSPQASPSSKVFHGDKISFHKNSPENFHSNIAKQSTSEIPSFHLNSNEIPFLQLNPHENPYLKLNQGKLAKSKPHEISNLGSNFNQTSDLGPNFTQISKSPLSESQHNDFANLHPNFKEPIVIPKDTPNFSANFSEIPHLQSNSNKIPPASQPSNENYYLNSIYNENNGLRVEESEKIDFKLQTPPHLHEARENLQGDSGKESGQIENSVDGVEAEVLESYPDNCLDGKAVELVTVSKESVNLVGCSGDQELQSDQGSPALILQENNELNEISPEIIENANKELIREEEDTLGVGIRKEINNDSASTENSSDDTIIDFFQSNNIDPYQEEQREEAFDEGEVLFREITPSPVSLYDSNESRSDTLVDQQIEQQCYLNEQSDKDGFSIITAPASLEQEVQPEEEEEHKVTSSVADKIKELIFGEENLIVPVLKDDPTVTIEELEEEECPKPPSRPSSDVGSEVSQPGIHQESPPSRAPSSISSDEEKPGIAQESQHILDIYEKEIFCDNLGTNLGTSENLLKFLHDLEKKASEEDSSNNNTPSPLMTMMEHHERLTPEGQESFTDESSNSSNTTTNKRSSPDGEEIQSPKMNKLEEESFQVTSSDSDNSWIEEVPYEEGPPPLDLTLHTIVEESCEDSESESVRLSFPRSNRNALENYFNYLDPIQAAQGAIADAHRKLTHEDSEFSDTFSESSFNSEVIQAQEDSIIDPVDLASTRLEKYFTNLSYQQHHQQPPNGHPHQQSHHHLTEQDSEDSVGSESENDDQLKDKKKKVLKHKRSANVSDDESIFDQDEGAFDTIKKSSKKKAEESNKEQEKNKPTEEAATPPAKPKQVLLDRSNSFQWSSDEEVNLMMSKLRHLIKNLMQKSSTTPSETNSQLRYFETELIRLMRAEPELKNIVSEYISSEESDDNEFNQFIKDVVTQEQQEQKEKLLSEKLPTSKLIASKEYGGGNNNSPALIAKVMHHIGNRLSVWMKDEEEEGTLKCAPSVSSDLNEDRFSWKGSFESTLAAKRQSVGSTDSISSSDFNNQHQAAGTAGVDRSILRSSSLHHLANSQPIEEKKEEEENISNSLPKLNQVANMSRAQSLIGIKEKVKSARYRPPGFTQAPSIIKQMDDKMSMSTPVLHQETTMVHPDTPMNLRSSADSIASMFEHGLERINIRGQIEFGLQYNYKLASLEVRVKQCRDLAAIDSKRNRSDPYVKAYLLPDRSKSGKRKTKTKKNTLNPILEETLKFPVSLSELQTRTLWISVWHNDIFGKNEFLGQIMLPLKDRVFDDPSPKWWSLEQMSVEVNDHPRGDLIIALKWLPRTQNTGNLSVLVKEAKDLLPTKNGCPSTFVKCSPIKESKSHRSKQKTSIARRTLHPIWNQTLYFEDVPDDGIEVSLWNYDLLSNHDLIGNIRLDSNHPLWESMLSRHSFWVEGGLKLDVVPT